MDPYRAPERTPDPPNPSRWRERGARGARVILAVMLPFAVGWLVTIGVRRDRCSPTDYVRLLWGAPGLALACSIGITLLILTGTRLSNPQ